MDIATIAGLLLGSGLVLVSMLMSGPLTMFWDLTSLIIVVGGAIFANMIQWPMDIFINGLKASMKVLFSPPTNAKDAIDKICECAEVARKGSVLALDKVEIEIEFLAKGIRYLVDGYPPESISTMLDMEINNLRSRHNDSRGIMEAMGDLAPAWGMIGTVVGLIVIMANLDDPDAIGPGIAVALITTLYGSMFANLIFIPFATKLKYRSKEESVLMDIMKEGILAIADGENPRIIRQKLETFLMTGEREKEEAA